MSAIARPSARNVAFSKPCFGPEEAQAAADVVASGWVVGGPHLRELEARFATVCETEHAIGVSSWTTGAFLVLKCLGIGPGDEVIVPSMTFISSVNVIVHAGATPVFADIDPRTLNIDPSDVAAKITPRTRAIVPVDQLGIPCEIDRIVALSQKHGLLLMQDAACSVGSRFRDRPCGSMAPVTVFSLHARKLVTTGEGGMIVTNDSGLAARLRRQRHQGMSLSDFERHRSSPTTFETYPEIGYNFRMTDIQAAIGVVQMGRLDAMLSRRRAVAQRYIAALSSHPFVRAPDLPDHLAPNWQSFQVLLTNNATMSRNETMSRLESMGVATRRGVMASHLEPPYLRWGANLPRTEDIAARSFQLPIFSNISDDEVTAVTSALSAL